MSYSDDTIAHVWGYPDPYPKPTGFTNREETRMTTRVERLNKALAELQDGDRIRVRHEIEDDELVSIGTYRGTEMVTPPWASDHGTVELRAVHVDVEYPGGVIRQRSILYVTILDLQRIGGVDRTEFGERIEWGIKELVGGRVLEIRVAAVTKEHAESIAAQWSTRREIFADGDLLGARRENDQIWTVQIREETN